MQNLIDWKNSPTRKPLILEWARQVWKTYILKEFWKKYFKNMIYINFQNPSNGILELFKWTLDPKKIIKTLSLIYGEDILPQDTLLFFDEIQATPRALESLKYFCEDTPEYAVVTAWSLLGVFLHPGTSFPVGKVQTLELYPLDFEEYLWANWKKQIVDELKKDPFISLFDDSLYELFKEYLFLWWMPAVVKNWLENHLVSEVETLQEQILKDYQWDFSKYTDKSVSLRILEIFKTIAPQLGKENWKFIYNLIRTWARAREYEQAVERLVEAGLTKKVYNTDVGNKIPLRGYINMHNFKLYFLDVWLLRKLANIPYIVIQNKDQIFNEFNGMLTEQFVLQQLSQYELFYWTLWKSEVDFIMQRNNIIIPIEVKSGTNLRAKSLINFKDKYHPVVATRFSLQKTEIKDWLIEISLYKSFLFDEIINQFLNKE